MSERFYVNWPLAEGAVVVEGAEAHHLAGVCRIRPGDAVCLFNGDGLEYPARVLTAGRREVTLEVAAPLSVQRELAIAMEVAAPLPKGDRTQFLLEKLTELGVRSFVPLRTRRSMVHPREARLDRLQRHVIEASKQCGRNVLLQVQPLTNWEAYCRRGDLAPLRVLAHPGAERETMRQGDQVKRWRGGAGVFSAEQGVAFAVGPEGGFTEEEVGAGREAGWRVVDLGPRLLRVETAALVLAASVVFPSPPSRERE
jgi:16S rRNA (uracil1498-N3)-methyltransferase